MLPPVIRASRALPMVWEIPPASSTTTRRLGAWIPWRAVSLYWAGANPKAARVWLRFHSTVRHSPSSWCVAWSLRMWDQRMLRTWRNEVAVVTTWEVPAGWVITHHATMRAARCDLPGAWQAGTAVRLLSRTETRISRCLDHRVSPRPVSTKPMGSWRYWDHGSSAIRWRRAATVARSSEVRVASHVFRSEALASRRNLNRRPSALEVSARLGVSGK